MHLVILLACALVQGAPAALTKSEVAATSDFALSLYDPATGAFRVSPATPPGLRATHGGVQVLTALGTKLPDAAKTRAFVESCYDPEAKAFREPGQASNPAINSVGIMAALSLGVPKDKVRPALVTLGATAKNFEEVRIGAAAVEAFGPKECPFELGPWEKEIAKYVPSPAARYPQREARLVGSIAAFYSRLGLPVPQRVTGVLEAGQQGDGGYGGERVDTSDLETTYRVMRAPHYLGEKPRDAAKLKAFVASCRREGGGYGVSPGAGADGATMSGAYYAVKVLGWLE